MFIDELYISKEYRKKGIAKCFMLNIIAEYEKNVVLIEVAAMEDNVAALNLCEKLGFTISEYIPLYRIQDR
jgi:ribosomal protein S18 acetylase RimI-like enzyme